MLIEQRQLEAARTQLVMQTETVVQEILYRLDIDEKYKLLVWMGWGEEGWHCSQVCSQKKRSSKLKPDGDKTF